MSSMTPPARKSPVRNEDGGQHEQQDHERVDQGFAKQLDARMALVPGYYVSPGFLQPLSSFLLRKPTLDVRNFPNTTSTSTPAASRSSDRNPCGRRRWVGPVRDLFGITGVGNAGITHLVSLCEKDAEFLLRAIMVIR